jgi:hypothetical protein
MSLTMVLYYWDLFFWTLSIALTFCKPQRFKGCFFPRPQVKPTVLGLVDQASLYLWTIPCGLKNIRAMDKSKKQIPVERKS